MLEDMLTSFFVNLPTALIHFGTTMTILIAGAGIYTLVTPYSEIKLIRQGNVAAAISFSGAMLGLAIPLAAAMSTSVNPIDILLWGLLALLIMLTIYWLVDHLLKGIPEKVEQGDCAAATALAGIKLATAIVLAPAVAG